MYTKSTSRDCDVMAPFLSITAFGCGRFNDVHHLICAAQISKDETNVSVSGDVCSRTLSKKTGCVLKCDSLKCALAMAGLSRYSFWQLW